MKDKSLDEIDLIFKTNTMGGSGRFDAENASKSILALKSKWETEARIDELKPLLTAKIRLGASPAPFNPEGLPVNTPETEEMTKLLQNYASDRIKELWREK